MLSDAYLLHWSNIVGSTHSNDFRLWQYDHYASRAVKEVCEFGSSRSLENVMKENVSTQVYTDVRSFICSFRRSWDLCHDAFSPKRGTCEEFNPSGRVWEKNVPRL
ncbi:hypothetical protein [Thiolapillus sp.]|uniref:hypothetical protein n=1 Tax=Thiolapillus sp. TaxID=2017437 RepID=UPI003AF41865